MQVFLWMYAFFLLGRYLGVGLLGKFVFNYKKIPKILFVVKHTEHKIYHLNYF